LPERHLLPLVPGAAASVFNFAKWEKRLLLFTPPLPVIALKRIVLP